MTAKSSLRVEDRCWALWLGQIFTLESRGEIVSEHLICCQLGKGHAHEHQSSTIIGEISWGKYDDDL